MKISVHIMQINKDNYAPDGHVYTVEDLESIKGIIENIEGSVNKSF